MTHVFDLSRVLLHRLGLPKPISTQASFFGFQRPTTFRAASSSHHPCVETSRAKDTSPASLGEMRKWVSSPSLGAAVNIGIGSVLRSWQWGLHHNLRRHKRRIRRHQSSTLPRHLIPLVTKLCSNSFSLAGRKTKDPTCRRCSACIDTSAFDEGI